MRLMALWLALLTGGLAIAPAAVTYRCIWMKRQMSVDHACCPSRIVTPHGVPQTTLSRQCCEAVAPTSVAPTTAASRVADGLEPPRVELALVLTASEPLSVALVSSRRALASRAGPPHDHLHRLATVLRI